MTDASRAALHEHGLAASDTGAVDQSLPRGDETRGVAAASRIEKREGSALSRRASTAANSASEPCFPLTPPVTP
jgi:hypothetical protein